MNDLCKTRALAMLLALLVCCCGAPAPDPTAEGPAPAPATTPAKMISSPSPAATDPTATDGVSPADLPTLEPSPSPPPTAASDAPEPPGQMRITIVYDNTAIRERLEAEWGFAAWIEYGDHTVLFDTGPDGKALLSNLAGLGLEPERIDVVVLSHIHGDHTGGLSALLGTGIQPVVYAPAAFPESFKRSVRARTELVEVRDALEMLPGLHSTGPLGGNPAEQAMVVETSEGAVILTGCAHPGIVRILGRARNLVEGEIALVMGGFHLANASSMTVEGIIDTFREYGVKQVSATHCTGEESIQAFAVEYGENHLEGGAGRVITVGQDGLYPTEPGTSRDASAPWPTDGWRTSTPEEQGMDSALLASMLAEVREKDHAIDSVQVVRNGYLVVDAYVHPFGPDRKHVIHSCTKSVVSALAGIAIEQGYLEGADQAVVELFPDRTIANLDEAKEAMTLEDVLTMATGLECRDSYLYRWRGLEQMRQSRDWVQFMLDLPLVEKPGTRFEYCNGASFLLSAIVQRETGVSAAEYAAEHLFGPLGIEDVEWPSNPQGISIGWGQMRMRSHDMAKLGYLYLNGGWWGDRQVVPAGWVDASAHKQIAATLQDGYGYQWWVSDAGYYMALGYAGQFIYVVPDKDLVVVFASNLEERDFYVPQQLLDGYIIPAARSEGPLPANPDGVAELEARTQALTQP